MARPQKEGMDYFPHDTNASADKKVEILRLLYGNDGYAFYFIMLEQIYQERDFELDISDAETREETFQILARKVGVNRETFEKMLHTALKRDCFDQVAFEERQVLTSGGIKKRASVVLEKREKMRTRYHTQQGVSAAETREETKEETPQRKEKKREVKEKIYNTSPAREDAEKNKTAKAAKLFDESSIEIRLALRLRTAILKHSPSAISLPKSDSLIDMQKWARVFDLMLRLDKISSVELEKLIDFATTDQFWHRNILSPEKLRKQVDRLRLDSSKREMPNRQVAPSARKTAYSTNFPDDFQL